jgi:hypothetical protein
MNSKIISEFLGYSLRIGVIECSKKITRQYNAHFLSEEKEKEKEGRKGSAIKLR